MAASILVEVLRKGSDLASSGGVRETIPRDEVAAVGDEVKALTAKYRLRGADAPLWQASPPGYATISIIGIRLAYAHHSHQQ